MKECRSILACIDDFDRDITMLRYIENLARTTGTNQVHLIYATDDIWRPSYMGAFSLPESRLDSGIPPIPDTPLDDQKERLENMAHLVFGTDSSCEVYTHVVFGSPLQEIMDHAMSYNVDLIAMRQNFGESNEKGSRSLFARRIARRSTCSVLTIPETFEFTPPNIIVPIRDSECSQNAFVAACNIAESSKGMIEALNIYQVHSDYLLSSVPLSIHIDNLENIAVRETQSLLDRTVVGNVEIHTHFMPDMNADPVSVIKTRITQLNANMIVIGARGRTGAAGILLGTVTEQLIQHADIPVMAVKTKGECIGVVKALLEMMGVEQVTV